MTAKVTNLPFVLALSLILGCTKKSTHPFPSEAELTNAIPAGLTKAELFARYGIPSITLPEQNGAEWLKYVAPDLRDDVPTNWQYTGFNVTLTNGRVAHVGASHRDIIAYRPLAKSGAASAEATGPTSQVTNAASSISFYEVNDEPVAGGRYVDTRNLPKTGYIRNAADFVVTEVLSVERGQQIHGTGSNDSREVLTVTLTEADAKHFAKLTERLMGKRLLISVGNQPIIAPIVQAPIETGSFILDVQAPEETERLFDQLRKLARN